MTQEKEINQLPKDWKWVKLGEYVISVKGKKPKHISKEKTKECSIPYVNIKAFEKNIIDEYTDGVGCALCEEGDFLMVWDGSRSGYVGKAIKGALGSTLVKLNFPEIENSYAYYFLQSKFTEINTRAKGVGIPHVDPNILWNYNLLIPPKTTQLAIVSKIEELFSEIENGIKSLFTAQQQLKTYRQSVLKWAFEGKLSESGFTRLEDEQDNRQDKKSRKSLHPENPDSDKGELPEGWKWVKLGDVCDKIQDGSHFSPQVQYDEPGENRFKYITAKNIRNDYMDFRKLTYVDKDFHDSIYDRCNPEFGDVLLTKDGINTGEVTLNTLHEPFSLLSSVCILKTKKKDLKSEYLKYFIQSPLGSKAILQSMTGTAIKRIVLKKIKESKITLPTIEEQGKIVQAIESRLSVADKMEESITQSLQQAEALKQSILKKAFEGKLLNEKQEFAKIIPIQRKVLASWIIHLNYDHKYFGLTKFQKTLYLCEQYAQVEYETNYEQERAGPYDREFTLAFRKEIIENDIFQEETKVSLTHFVPGLHAGIYSKDYPKYFRNKGNKIKFVLQLLKDKTLNEAELIATIYAVWNNMIILKKTYDISAIIEAVYDWSPEKIKYSKEDISSTVEWMKEKNFVPIGFGKIIK